MNPKVSVIVPVFRVEKYIERCARSLFEQTYDNIEYIFVDDCSPDKSITKLKRVLSMYPNRKKDTKIVKHLNNRGLAAARNTGIENATGDFFMHVDSDDWIVMDAVEKLVDKQSENDADIVEFDYITYHKNGSKVRTKFPEYDSRINHIFGVFQNKVPRGVVFRFTRASIYKISNVHNIEGANIGEDLYVVSQLIWFANKIDVLHEPLYYYDNTNNSSLTSQLKVSQIKQQKLNIDGLSVFFKDKSPDVYEMVMICRLKMMVEDLARLARERGNKIIFKQIQEEVAKCDFSYYKYIEIPYRPFLHIRNYGLLRIYSMCATYVKNIINKLN